MIPGADLGMGVEDADATETGLSSESHAYDYDDPARLMDKRSGLRFGSEGPCAHMHGYGAEQCGEGIRYRS